MEHLICSLSVIWLIAMSLFVALLFPILIYKNEQKKGGKESMSGKTLGKGHDSEPVDAELNANGEDPFELFVELANQMRDELGLPRLPIETVQAALGKASKGLLKQLEWHIAPIFKDNASGWVSLMLEMIGEHNKDIAQLLIDGNRRGMELLRLQETCRTAQFIGRCFVARRLHRRVGHQMREVEAQRGKNELVEYTGKTLSATSSKRGSSPPF